MIWIDGQVPSLKNSKIKTSRGVFPSKTVAKYLREMGIMKYSVRDKSVTGYKTKENKFETLREDFIKALKGREYPIKIGFHFVRSTKHKFDFHNAVQIIADLMVAHDFIEDDNMDCFLPIPLRINGVYYSYNPDKPGVYIKIY